MKFTGEQVVPDDVENKYLYFEHFARYMYAARLVSGKKVLDLGCGTGYGAAYLASQGADLVVGVDINNEAIKYARHHYQAANLLYIGNNCYHPSFESQLFDVVVSFEVIEHVEDAKSYLAEIKRILKPGGCLIGSTPNKQLHSPTLETSYNPFHVREYFLADLQQLLDGCFVNVSILGQSPLQGFVIGKKLTLSDFSDTTFLKDVGLILEKNGPEKNIDKNAKDFVFICQKGNHLSSDPNLTKREEVCFSGKKVYLAEHYGIELMKITHSIRRHQTELARLNDMVARLNARVRGFEEGRFIKLMSRLHRLRKNLFQLRRRDIDA